MYELLRRFWCFALLSSRTLKVSIIRSSGVFTGINWCGHVPRLFRVSVAFNKPTPDGEVESTLNPSVAWAVFSTLQYCHTNYCCCVLFRPWVQVIREVADLMLDSWLMIWQLATTTVDVVRSHGIILETIFCRSSHVPGTRHSRLLRSFQPFPSFSNNKMFKCTGTALFVVNPFHFFPTKTHVQFELYTKSSSRVVVV